MSLIKEMTLKNLTLIALAVALSACASKSGSRGSEDLTSGAYGTGESSTGGIGLGTLQRVHFEFDRSAITSDAASILQNNAKIINSNSKMRVLVEGHCDERGTNEYNIALGERRAQTTLDYLVSLGVPRNRLEMKSWGEEKPLDTDKTESSYRLNRRAEFVVLAK